MTMAIRKRHETQLWIQLRQLGIYSNGAEWGGQWIEKYSAETARVEGFFLNQLKILAEGRPGWSDTKCAGILSKLISRIHAINKTAWGGLKTGPRMRPHQEESSDEYYQSVVKEHLHPWKSKGKRCRQHLDLLPNSLKTRTRRGMKQCRARRGGWGSFGVYVAWLVHCWLLDGKADSRLAKWDPGGGGRHSRRNPETESPWPPTD